jgi:hypothetical protein
MMNNEGIQIIYQPAAVLMATASSRFARRT